MKQVNYNFSYQVFDHAEALPEMLQQLRVMAAEITEKAYAPYSRFFVGAAAILSNGAFVTGTNQENASFPAGICAERVLLSTAASLYPGVSIDILAISYKNQLTGNSHKPLFPCGICRQSLVEQQVRQQKAIQLLLSGQTGDIILVERADYLLPFGFSSEDLRR